MSSDPASFLRIASLWRSRPNGLVAARLRPLGGEAVYLRRGTADLWALIGMDPPVHLPPAEIPSEEIRNVWDLGANIGLTMAHLASRFPGARVVGVELDEANAALCRRNIAAWGPRCELVEAAVWDSDGSVAYAANDNELSYSVDDGVPRVDGAGLMATAVSLNALLERYRPDEWIDFVKMDIEGAEARVLRANTEWAERVRSIKVEVHPPYTVEECHADLERLGFRTEIDPVFQSFLVGMMPPVLGVRPEGPPESHSWPAARG